MQRRRRQRDLEGQVGAGVRADRVAVEPDLRAVVHRLEAHDPGGPAPGARQAEVAAVPADAAGERGLRLIRRVPGARDAHGAPAGGARPALPAGAQAGARGVAAEEPRAVEQEAPRRPGGIERARARRRHDRLGGGARRGHQRRGATATRTRSRGDRGGRMRWVRTPGAPPRCGAGCAGQQGDSRPMGALRRRRLTERPASTVPPRETSTHCTTGRPRPTTRQATRVGPVLPPRA